MRICFTDAGICNLISTTLIYYKKALRDKRTMETDMQNRDVDTSPVNKEPFSMEIDTPDRPSTHTDNLNKRDASTIEMDQTEHCNLDPCKPSQSNLESMDRTNTITSDLVEPSDLGISDNITSINVLEEDQLDNIEDVDKASDVEMLNRSNTDSLDTNEAQQQNMSIDSLKQSNSDIAKDANNLSSSEKLDQTTPANIVQPNTSEGNLDQSNADTEDSSQKIQPNTSTESVDQPIKNKGKLDQSCVIPENMDQPSTSTGNADEISTTTLEMLHKLGTSVQKVDQVNTNQENSGKQNASVAQVYTKECPPEEKVKLFAEDKGPHWHNVVHNLVTPPVIATNLPKVFKNFPIFGKPENRADVENFYDREIRNFVGCDLSDSEYEELKNYCSIDNLRTGKEFTMKSKIPSTGTFQQGEVPEATPTTGDKPDLFVLRKLKARIQRDLRNLYNNKSKYRGVRLIPLSSQEEQSGIAETEPPDLEPGKDVLYRIRVYRPFVFSSPRVKAQIRGRHSVFSCDVVVCGRQPLTALRDRLVCRNDADLRLDVSSRPHDRVTITAKDWFPSGFLFINNVFYVDRRRGCRDTSAVLRAWAAQRGIGRFPVLDMASVTMQDVNVRLAHPEVYVHQGNCEHVFLVSEIRLLNYSDPLHLSCYPCHTAVSQNQTIYCTTCAEFGGKWIVTGCDRVPFDPAFFCDTCFKQYLYKNGKKIGDFKAYAYKGNELSMLKPS